MTTQPPAIHFPQTSDRHLSRFPAPAVEARSYLSLTDSPTGRGLAGGRGPSTLSPRPFEALVDSHRQLIRYDALLVSQHSSHLVNTKYQDHRYTTSSPHQSETMVTTSCPSPADSPESFPSGRP